MVYRPAAVIRLRRSVAIILLCGRLPPLVSRCALNILCLFIAALQMERSQFDKICGLIARLDELIFAGSFMSTSNEPWVASGETQCVPNQVGLARILLWRQIPVHSHHMWVGASAPTCGLKPKLAQISICPKCPFGTWMP
jgi:hypothetical protein